MRTVSDLLGLTGAKPTSDAPGIAPEQPSVDQPAREKGTLADVGARIGEDNEALRNLLIDTGHRLGTIDSLKETFGRLVEPLHNVLTALEQERADHASSKGALAALRGNQDTLHAEFKALQRQASELRDDNARLSRDLATAHQRARELEDEKTKLGGEAAAARGTLAQTTKQLAEESGSVRSLTEERRLLADRGDIADKRVIALEAEVALTNERLSLMENDKDNLQAALDKTLAESARLSRHLAKTESALGEASNRMQQFEKDLAAAEAERKKLAAACDEVNGRRQSELHAMGLKLDAAQSRSEAAEKLLASARQSLLARTEELRTAEAKMLDANLARSQAEKKAKLLAASSEDAERETKRLTQDNSELAERCKALSEALSASEGALLHAKDKIGALIGQVEQLQSSAAETRTKTEAEFVQLRSTIEQERCERALAEGALETTRNDYARLQREIAQERASRRPDH